MKSFEKKFLKSLPISNELLKTVREIGEYRGKEDLFKQQSPQTLETLIQNAIIQSTESSNRIEGIEAESPERLKALMKENSRPKNRPEQEIAGYRDVLGLIHHSHDDMHLNANLVLQLHRDLFKFSSTSGGSWKKADNEIVETKVDGTRRLRFKLNRLCNADADETVPILQFEEAERSADSGNRLDFVQRHVSDFFAFYLFMAMAVWLVVGTAWVIDYQVGHKLDQFSALFRALKPTTTLSINLLRAGMKASTTLSHGGTIFWA